MHTKRHEMRVNNDKTANDGDNDDDNSKILSRVQSTTEQMNDSNYVNGEFFVRIKSLLHFHTSCWLLSHIHRRFASSHTHTRTHIFNRLVVDVFCVLNVLPDCLLTTEMSTELKMHTVLPFITFTLNKSCGVFLFYSADLSRLKTAT